MIFIINGNESGRNITALLLITAINNKTATIEHRIANPITNPKISLKLCQIKLKRHFMCPVSHSVRIKLNDSSGKTLCIYFVSDSFDPVNQTVALTQFPSNPTTL